MKLALAVARNFQEPCHHCDRFFPRFRFHQGKAADEMTDRIWALDQRTMLNSRAWLGESNQ